MFVINYYGIVLIKDAVEYSEVRFYTKEFENIFFIVI